MSETPQRNSIPPACRAERLVRNYSRTPGYQGEPDYEDDIVDFLTDLRHFCAGRSLDFEELDEGAERHCVAERREGVHRCAGCGTLWATDELERIDDLQDRVDPGEIMPSGRCPDCGAPCHPQFSGGVMRILVSEDNDNGERGPRDESEQAPCPCCGNRMEHSPAGPRVDLELLRQQAAILGKVVDEGPLTDDDRSCLEGLWEFVHSVIDSTECQAVIKNGKEGAGG